ncbi:FecR domain-containing protein [Candidatus Peregrinibacteria bacterium]|nr:FecR domain-containing protein [Candidatus Peregrinibacteria bacterium]
MDRLTNELHRLSKIKPPRRFIRASKKRLMHQIELHERESWLKAFLKKLGQVQVPEEFMSLARMRILHHITRIHQPLKVPLHGMARFLFYTKRAVASTLVMLIAVTSTLFFVEGNTVVEASDNSYLEIISGQASIKHPDLIVWEDINKLIEVQAGDLIKVDDDSEVIIHFFDDTEVRVGENSELLISQLTFSSAFNRQAIIKLSLHKGTAWVQTLNVEDGYAGFVLSTRNALARMLNGTFYATADINQPTSVFVFNGKLTLSGLMADTRQIVKTVKLSTNQKAGIHTVNGQPVITTATLDQQDRSNEWVQNNLNRDSEHLTTLRENSISHLQQLAGTLPGDMLYPVKQMKERMRLALSSNSNLDILIEIANRRLNEAFVLFEAGDMQKGQEALMAYQSLTRQIAEAKKDKELVSKLIVPHQKTLAAEPPNATTGLIKEALHQTAEIFADDPVELEKIRLASSVQRLEDVVTLVDEGAFDIAKERLVSHQLATSDALAVAEAIEDEEEKKQVLQEVLELRQEELALLSTLSETLATDADEDLAAMVESATEVSEENVEVTLAAALPLLPELQQYILQPSATEIRMAELISKIYIYNSWTGQQNQIERLLKNELANPSSIGYLLTVRDHLEGRAYDYLNVRILQLQKKADYQKHKAMQRKIERAQRLREA